MCATSLINYNLLFCNITSDDKHEAKCSEVHMGYEYFGCLNYPKGAEFQEQASPKSLLDCGSTCAYGTGAFMGFADGKCVCIANTAFEKVAAWPAVDSQCTFDSTLVSVIPLRKHFHVEIMLRWR